MATYESLVKRIVNRLAWGGGWGGGGGGVGYLMADFGIKDARRTVLFLYIYFFA